MSKPIPKNERGRKVQGACWERIGGFVYFRCPDGHFSSLFKHAIASDGEVTPSVKCPRIGCLFHETVKLQGWTPCQTSQS